MIQEAVLKVVNEAEYLNISIKNVDKVIKDKNIAELLDQNVTVYGKYDGTKLSILRTDKTWNEEKWWEMFIVSYKGNVLYGTEYADSTDDPKELDSTVGVSQYKSIFNHISKYYKGWKSLPTNHEFFFEFLMNKPTLTRSYTKLRELVLIGYAPVSSYKENHGKISTKPQGFIMEGREVFAKIFKVNLPETLFKGKLRDLPNGLSERAKETYANFDQLIKGSVTDSEYWNFCKAFFLDIPSLYGSPKEEGVVIHLERPIGSANILKIMQSDQYDKTVRGNKKNQFKMEYESENQYWINIRAKASEIIGEVDYTKPLHKVLKDVSRLVYKQWDINIAHTKKTDLNIRDDLQLTVKSMLIRLMPGNNGALVVGKFRVFTNGHKKMFEQALKDHDSLVVALVSNKETKSTLSLRRRMIEANFPKVEIIETTSGNLLTIINKTSTNINTVFAGSDRVKTYKEQLKRNLDVGVEEVKRGEDDESATKVLSRLKDIKYFKRNVPKGTQRFYTDLLKVYVQNETLRNKLTLGWENND